MPTTQEFMGVLETVTDAGWRIETDTPTLKKFIGTNSIDFTIERLDGPKDDYDWLFIMEDSVMSSDAEGRSKDSAALHAFEKFVEVHSDRRN